MSDHPVEKKGFTTKVWGIFAVVVGAGIGIVVIVILGGVLVQMGLDSFGAAMSNIGNSMNNVGNVLANFSGSIRVLVGGGLRIVMTLALYALVFVGIGYISYLIYKEVKKGVSAGG